MAAEVTVEVVLDEGPGRRSVLSLCWQPADPLAVSLQLTALPEHPALPRGRWVVLRDSLRAGLTAPVGDGDVRVRPEGDQVCFALARPGRPADVRVPASHVRQFLSLTELQLAGSQRTCEQAVDDLLARVLYS